MRILIFNVKYSPNLGDGVLATCLEHGLRDGGPDITVETVDLAGREGYEVQGARRMRALSVLRHLPKPLRATIVELVLRRRLSDLTTRWQGQIEEADAVVIGGGNLFQDDDLNFPLKVAAVLEGVRTSGKPLAVFAVGVTGSWSARARRLFAKLLDCKVVHVSVRDQLSRDNWLAHFGDRFDVEVCPDPGLLARDFLRGEALPYVGSPVVGLGVTHPLVLRRHAGIPHAQIPLVVADEYRALVKFLITSGCRVMLFTNGAAEDEHFIQRVLDDPSSRACLRSGTLTVAPRPGDPEALVANLRRSAIVIAHRLHASIVAHSLGIPSVGLGWDRKVNSFFQEIGRRGYVLQGESANPAQIGERALQAMKAGIDPAEHARQLGKAKEGIFRLSEKLRGGVRRRKSHAAEV